MKEFHLSADQVNINGGAVALGHPIGASGARLVATATSLLRRLKKQRAIVTLCNGGGEATAMVLERMSS